MSPASRLDWLTDGRDWPNRDASRFVRCGAIRWHVQVLGEEQLPAVVLIHGTGASTHSWRDVAPLLANSFRVIAFDLPGHGFTQGERADFSLPGIASAAAQMLKSLGVAEAIGVGHSAGAAILLQMALDDNVRFGAVVTFNGALRPIKGDFLFSPLAKALFSNPVVPRVFSAWARHTGVTGRMVDRTGGMIDRRGRDLYMRLLADPAHVAGALGMMAHWDLAPLQRRLSAISCPVTLVATENDPLVPASVSREAAARIPRSQVVMVRDGGHLLHEVRPQFAAQIIRERALEETAKLPLD